MITAPSPLPQPGLELSTRTERQATFRQPGTQQETSRQPATSQPSAAPPGATTAAQIQASGLRLPALLLPLAQHAASPQAAGSQAAGLAVELRLALPGGGSSASPGAGLVATVVDRLADRGLVLDLAGHRLTVSRGLIDLPLGATLTLQLRLPGGRAFIDDAAGLERLVRTSANADAPGSKAATLGGDQGSMPLSPDARLAVRLLTDWRSLAGRATGQTAPASATGGARTSSLELRVDGESGRSMLLDRDTGWRALFGLLGEAGEPVQPVTLWRRERSAAPDSDGEERLLLTLDLSRLGRISLDLRTSPGRLWVAIASPEPLPQPLRAQIGEAFAAAAELAGLEPALVFRGTAAAGLPGVAPSRDHLTDWVG